MLLEKNLPDELERFIGRNKCKELLVWYGQLKESEGDIDAAIEKYRAAPST